jgi:hypothetical protein
VALSVPAVRYLFAAGWAPHDSGAWTVKVPGATVAGMDLAGNLLNLAIWSLREQGLVDLEQLRGAEREEALILGGKPFARMTPRGGDSRPPGLEGRVLDAARAAAADAAADDDSAGLGVRRILLRLDLPYQGPWTKVAGICFAEAHAAGLVATKGRVFKKPVIADAAGVEALHARDEEIVAARKAYREQNAALDAAVIGDCLSALRWAYGGAD